MTDPGWVASRHDVRDLLSELPREQEDPASPAVTAPDLRDTRNWFASNYTPQLWERICAPVEED